MSFLFGSPEKYGQVSTLGKEQRNNYNQFQRGAGSALPQAQNYYSSLLNDDNSTFNAFAAPEMRQFREQTIPDLAEQFAGMGSGGLSSSGFRNAGINAGTDLQERLASIRANLRQQGAAGLAGIGQFGLSPQFQENTFTPRTPGFLENAAPLLGNIATQAAGAYFGVPPGVTSAVTGGFGKSSPYGNQQQQTPASYYPGSSQGFQNAKMAGGMR